ncbi:MAG: type II and III secretion system protein family protein [Actinomycetota bacterium]
MRPLSRLFAAALLALFAATAGAQEGGTEPPAPAAAPRAKVVPVGGHAATPAAARAALPMIRGTLPTAAEPVRIALNKTAEVALTAQVKDIVIGNPDIADVMVRSPTQVFLTGRGVGQTNVFLLDRQGQAVRRLEVDVHVDSQALKEVLSQVLPDERNLQVSAVADSIYLSGSVRSDAAATTARTLARRFVPGDANVVNLMRIGNEQQVLLHVKVAEMQKSVLKELGVGLSASNVKVFDGGPIAGVTTNALTGLTQSAAQMFSTATLSGTGVGALVGTLQMLEKQGLIKTLVEPNLTAVSGETASMLAGGEIPIPIADNQGQISIEFKPFGVLLSFTPVVLDPGRMSLKMSTEVSSLSNTRTIKLSTAEIPAINVRRAATTVELPSGGSLMIAGLLQNDVTSTLAGLPGAMDIPILGALLKSSSFQRNETELVVIISAYVVQPVNGPALAAPTDGFAPSSDIDRFLFSKLQETYTRRGAEPPTPPGALKGPFGYIVE